MLLSCLQTQLAIALETDIDNRLDVVFLSHIEFEKSSAIARVSMEIDKV